MPYTMTIGLEIHCKLLTDSKVFCRCRNEQDFDILPANTHVCPICMGLPGALPIINKECVEKAGALGMLLGCTQQEVSFFDRKSYFYPDLPMGYQITQFTKPLNITGKVSYHSLDYSEEYVVDIEQAHIECDTAKTTHINGNLLLDFNRAGTPLIEVVTAPQFHTAEQVHGFLREIQRTLKYYNISDAEMDKGQMRCDVNISISKDHILGTKVEIKNMNSISAIKRAIQYEYEIQVATLEKGEMITQETKGWDDASGESYTMRTKGDALDYRYFPEPDLPPLHYTATMKAKSASIIGETIANKISRYKYDYLFHKEYINGILTDRAITHLFEDCIVRGLPAKITAKYIVNYLLANPTVSKIGLEKLSLFNREDFFLFLNRIIKEDTPNNIAKSIITTYLDSLTSSAHYKSIDELFASMVVPEGDDTTLQEIIQHVISTNEKVVNEYKNGKLTTIGFLIGQVMKQAKGTDPQRVQTLLVDALG